MAMMNFAPKSRIRFAERGIYTRIRVSTAEIDINRNDVERGHCLELNSCSLRPLGNAHQPDHTAPRSNIISGRDFLDCGNTFCG